MRKKNQSSSQQDSRPEWTNNERPNGNEQYKKQVPITTNRAHLANLYRNNPTFNQLMNNLPARTFTKRMLEQQLTKQKQLIKEHKELTQQPASNLTPAQKVQLIKIENDLAAWTVKEANLQAANLQAAYIQSAQAAQIAELNQQQQQQQTENKQKLHHTATVVGVALTAAVVADKVLNPEHREKLEKVLDQFSPKPKPSYKSAVKKPESESTPSPTPGIPRLTR